MTKTYARLLSALLLLPLAACGGGGSASSVGVSPTLPQQHPSAPPIGTALPVAGLVGNVSASATVSGGVGVKSTLRQLSSLRAASGFTISSVLVTGAIYPSYGGQSVVTNKQTLTPVNNQISIDLPFTNVPVGNNAWLALHLIAQGTDGSTSDLGWLAGVVNVGTNQTTVAKLDAASTALYQVFQSFLVQSMFSSADLADPSFATTLATRVASTGQTPDASVALYTPTQLDTIGTALQPQYEPTLTVTSGETSSSARRSAQINILPDYNSTAERFLAANRSGLSCTSDKCALPNLPASNQNFTPSDYPRNSTATTVVGPALGRPSTPTRIRPTSASGSTATFKNVYSGPTLVGATSGSAPYSGGWVQLAKVTAANAAVTVPSAATQTTVALNDPQLFAFPNQYCFRCEYSVQPMQNAIDPFVYTQLYYSNAVSLPSPFDATHSTVQLRTWNDINLPLASLQFCTNAQVDRRCVPLPSVGPSFDVQREFADPGTNFGYYNWQPGTGTASVATGYAGSTPQGLIVTTGGSATGSFVSTTPTYFGLTGSQMTINLNSGTYDSPSNVNFVDMPLAAWTVTATDDTGATYIGTSPPSMVGATVSFPTITKTVKVVRLVFAYAIPNGTPVPADFGISAIYSNYYSPNN